jgi:Trp operon repressor
MGPRRPDGTVGRRREIVRELKKRGVKQKVIAQKVNTPLRTIQRDFAVIRSEPESPLLRFIRKQFKKFGEEEIIKVL